MKTTQGKHRVDKEIRVLVRKAEAQGFRTAFTKNGVMVYAKDGVRMVALHLTPNGGKRSIQNAKARLRGIGVEV